VSRRERLGIIRDARQASREGDHALADKLLQLAGCRAIGAGK
jgi:hypothetical protein